MPWSDETRPRFDAIRLNWAQLQQQWTQEPRPSRDQALAQADHFVSEVDRFVETIEVQIAGWTAALHLFQLCMMALAIAAAVTFMAVSYLLVINPWPGCKARRRVCARVISLPACRWTPMTNSASCLPAST